MADSTSLVVNDLGSADRGVIALAGFLAGYGGRTGEAYGLDTCGGSSPGAPSATCAVGDAETTKPLAIT